MIPDRAFVVRALALYLPIALALLAWRVRRPSHRAAAGGLLASLWNFVALLAVNVAAIRAGWWHFDPTGARFYGVPVDLLLGWTVLWGIAAPLVATRVSVATLGIAALAADLALMPLCEPVLRLGERWLVGELVAVVFALIPGVLLARWTAEDRRLPARATLQLLCFAALVVGVLPATILTQTGGSWMALTSDAPRAILLQLQIAAIPALLGVSALQEFVERGRGTPLPFDSPRRLVTTGPYAYVANPMQLSTAVLLVVWGVVLQSGWVGLAGVMSFVYSAGLARMDEGVDLEQRFGEEWKSYRREVRNWIPRWRPAHPPARLYVSMSCGRCSTIARWFATSGAQSLEVVPDELHPKRDLRRVTYEMVEDDSIRAEGVAALARAVEHINFAWAMLGFFVRLPLVRDMLQLLADVSGGDEQIIPRRGIPECAPLNIGTE